jgi:hypothetical protein
MTHQKLTTLPKRGRPKSVGGKDYAVYLSETDGDYARQIGGGVLSAGIRLALQTHRDIESAASAVTTEEKME